jgi:hypothetical protein
MPKLTNEIIEAAIEGFAAQKHKIDAQIAKLRAMLNGTSVSSVTPTPGKTRRKFSAAALKRTREAQQRRWAKVRGESAPVAKAAPKPKKRKLSAAGRKAIVDALKKRWAAKNAAQNA